MILVTGGTGLIGSHLLYKLVRNGEMVKAIYRDKNSITRVSRVFGIYSKTPQDYIKKIKWVQADITDLGSLQGHFMGVDHVYHCAALISFDPKDHFSLFKINTLGTSHIVNLCLEHTVKKLCYVSSVAAIGPAGKGKTVSEETEWNGIGTTVYGLSKHDGELEVWRGSMEGLSVVIVNPGVVLGPGFRNSGSGLLFKYASKGSRFYFPGGTGFVSVDDVVDAMVPLMQSNVAGKRYILVNENLSYASLFQKIASYFGVVPPQKQIPKWAMEYYWRLDWLMSTLFGRKRKLTKNMVKGLYNRQRYDNTKSKHIPGFKYGSLDEAIAFCCAKSQVFLAVLVFF